MEEKGFFDKHPDMRIYLDRIQETTSIDTKNLKALITLVADFSYKDGFIDGIKTIMHELMNSNIPTWAIALITVTLAERVSSWPYGVLMSLKNIF